MRSEKRRAEIFLPWFMAPSAGTRVLQRARWVHWDHRVPVTQPQQLGGWDFKLPVLRHPGMYFKVMSRSSSRCHRWFCACVCQSAPFQKCRRNWWGEPNAIHYCGQGTMWPRFPHSWTWRMLWSDISTFGMFCFGSSCWFHLQAAGFGPIAERVQGMTWVTCDRGWGWLCSKVIWKRGADPPAPKSSQRRLDTDVSIPPILLKTPLAGHPNYIRVA